MVKVSQALEHSTFFKMLLLVNLTARPFERLYEKGYDIRLAEWRVVLALAGRPGLTASELADLLALDKMAVSRATHRLEQLDRVARVVDHADHRRSHLTLTEKGWELYRRIAPAGRAREALLLQPLSALELATLDAILDRLLAQARRMPHDQTESHAPFHAATIPGAALPEAQESG